MYGYLLLLHRRLLQIAEDIAHLVQVGRRGVRVPDPHDVGLFVGPGQRLEVSRILRLLVLQLRVVARVKEDPVSPVVEGLLPLGHVLHGTLRHGVQQVGQLQPVWVQRRIIATVIVDELVLLQEVYVQFLLPLGHALLALCGRETDEHH